MASNQDVTITGQITRVDLEGGFWGVVDQDNKHFVPLNPLSSEFQQHGLSVQIEAREVTVIGVSMWGQHIKIISIQKLS